MTVKVTNNGFSTLASGINNSATTIALATGEGARFPTLSTDDYFYGTLVDTSNNLEIVKVTARSTDSLTVVRAQDNTSARAFSTGDRFELRPVAKLFEDISEMGGGATGGGTDKVFNENSRTVTTTYSITAGKSALCVGPLTINTGVTVTIPSGERLVIL